MKRILASLCGALLALSACDRLAGTEVGNPEVTVAARFTVVGTGDSVASASLNLTVMGMGYSMPGDSGSCWNKPEGTMVEFSPQGSRGLKDTKVKDEVWTKAEMIFHAPAGSAALPDTGDIRAWANPRYARFSLVEGGDTLPALFDMPQGMELKLMFAKERIDSWRAGDTLWVPIAFDAGEWAGGLPGRGSWKTREDGKHARYVVFSASENPAAWAELKARLPGAFYADTVQVR